MREEKKDPEENKEGIKGKSFKPVLVALLI